MSDIKNLSWKDVFNTNHMHWGFILYGAQAAYKCGYEYFSWNERIYKVLDAQGNYIDTEIWESALDNSPTRLRLTLSRNLQDYQI